MASAYSGAMTKERLSASVDSSLVAAGRAAVAAGRAESLSAWVTEALIRHVEHDERLRALGEFIAEYEAEHGVITDEEIEQAKSRLQSRAIHVGRANAS